MLTPDEERIKEEGAQIAADLGLPEPGARKPSFPSDAVAQTAAVFASLAAARARAPQDEASAGDAAPRTCFDLN